MNSFTALMTVMTALVFLGLWLAITAKPRE